MPANPIENNLILTIVVPVYNVEEYLIQCLDSIDRSIRTIEAEVLLVDDGSTDTSGDMAQEYADGHEKFTCLHKPNGGLSDARNYGAARARGKYLAFVDSDDLVAENMYQNMIRAAEHLQAELTVINVARCNSKAVWASKLHRKAFTEIEDTGMHITENTRLFYDTTAWNKLILRSFWEENGFQYPVGWRFEDMPVSLAMHYQARKVAMVQEIGYFWRVRDGESLSITQENGTITNLVHRLEMLSRMFTYIDEKAGGDPKLLAAFKHKVLTVDLILYINQIRKISPELASQYRDEIMAFFARYFLEEDLASLPLLMRQKYALIFAGDFEHFSKVSVYGIKAYKQAPVIREDGRYRIQIDDELFTLPDRDMENDLREMNARVDVTSLSCTGSRASLQGYLYFPRISISTPEEMELTATLKEMVTGEAYPLSLKRVENKALTRERGFVFGGRDDVTSEYNYDGTGFAIEFAPDEIAPKEGDYLIQLHYRHEIKSGSLFLNERDLIAREYSEGIVLAGGETQAQIRHDAYGVLHFEIARGHVEEAAIDGNSREDSMDRHGEEVATVEHGQEPASDGPYVEAASLEGATLHLTMDGVPAGPSELVYFDTLRGEDQALACCPDPSPQSKADFAIDLSREEITADLYTGKRELRLKPEGARWEEAAAVHGYRCLREELTVGTLKAVFYCDSDCRLLMRTESLWAEDSISNDRRRYNRRYHYREYRKLPLDEKMIVFEAYWGAKYQCNPRYLYEYIDRNYPEYKCVWTLEDDRIPINGKGLRVRKYSDEYYRILATTKYLVNNVNFENAYVKRKGQVEIQTMHGTPYKSLGFDVVSDFPTEKHKVNYLKRNSRWNYLIVQGRFSESMAWQWFRYDKTILKTGYPRTDGLFDVSPEERTALKKKLGLPEDKEVIMYAPTFRTAGIYEMPLDLDRMRRELSDRYILLIRLHHFVAKSYRVPAGDGFLFDLGGYSNIEDLFKITDILITDYSSIMFDFALTGKPMIFHTYDLEEYVDDLRGSYFDITEEAPGPITRTDDELLAAIRSLEAGEIPGAERISRFREKYLTYENGHSSEKIFRDVFVEERLDAKVAASIKVKRFIKRFIPKKLFRSMKEKRMKNRV